MEGQGQGSAGRAGFQETLERLAAFMTQERPLLGLLVVYALAVGLFSLIIPLTVQELVNTFAFAIQPIMVLTLIAVMGVVLLAVGAFRVLQFYATDVLERRIFARVTLALAGHVRAFRDEDFTTEEASRFFETILMQRALSSLLVDLINVTVAGVIGMILLVVYHPYFVVFDALLIVSLVLIAVLGRGGLHTTLRMSEAKYDTFHWFQEVANNLLHFKSVASGPLILHRADELASAYIQARQSRFRVLVRQYIGSVIIQVFVHTGLLGMAGWLVAAGQLTVGQLVAAEVIIGSLLVSVESVVKRAYVIYYFFTAMTELEHLFSLPKDDTRVLHGVARLPQRGQGLKLTCERVGVSLNGVPLLQNLTFEVQPGEKWGVVCATETTRHLLARRLAGLDLTSRGVIRYNDMDLKEIGLETANACRGLVLSWQLSLFDGTVEDNITMGRTDVSTEDVLWAVKFTELQAEVEALPHGLQTSVAAAGKGFTPNQKLKLLVARAIAQRPPLLILDGGLYELRSDVRDTVLRRICAPEAPWSVVIVTTHADIKTFVQRCIHAA